MPCKGDFPGLQRQYRKDGSVKLDWVRSHVARKAGYPLKTDSLGGFIDGSSELSERCRELDAEQQAWLIEKARPDKPVKYDGTVGSLIRLYETDECSPYTRLKRKSEENADYELRKLKRAVAERRVEKLNGKDFWRWYWGFRQPAYEGGPERITDAYNIMTRARGVFTVGVLLRLPDCAELRNILSLIRFPNPESRKQVIKFQQVGGRIHRQSA